MKPIKWEVQLEPICQRCQTPLSKLGNSLRDIADKDFVTTYGWCTRCNYYQWSLPWKTDKSTREIIKDSLGR